MMSILLSILIPAPAQGGIDTTTPPPPPPPSNLLILAGIGAPPPPPPQGLIYQAKRHRSHPNTYFALKQRKRQLENSSFRDLTSSIFRKIKRYFQAVHLPKLSHGCIHQWEARLSTLPAMQLLSSARPGLMLVVRPDAHLHRTTGAHWAAFRVCNPT